MTGIQILQKAVKLQYTRCNGGKYRLKKEPLKYKRHKIPFKERAVERHKRD